MEEVRVDKWLWAVRVFKTRSIATEACKKGRISIAGVTVKPSRTIRVGEVVTVRKPPIEYSFLELQRVSGFVDRAKGLGRPTKKDRRDLDQFAEDLPEGMDLFDWDDDWD